MNKTLYLLLGTVLGACGSYLITKKLVTKKLKLKHEKELSEVKETLEKCWKEKFDNLFTPMEYECNPVENTEVKETEVKTKKKSNKQIKNITISSIDKNKLSVGEKATNYSKQYTSEKTEEEIKKESNKIDFTYDKLIYVVSPTDFQSSSYSTRTLYYYNDDVLVDEDDEEILDYVSMIGPDSLKTFGQFEEDCVYVRNDREEIDYEIILKHCKYHSTHSMKHKIIPEED